MAHNGVIDVGYQARFPWSFCLTTKLLATTPFTSEVATVWGLGEGSWPGEQREERDQLEKKCEDREAHEDGRRTTIGSEAQRKLY
jgi:hypothetical protein